MPAWSSQLSCHLLQRLTGIQWGANPNAFIQPGNMTLELQRDRVRFAPACYEDSQDIVSKQGISFRFMKNGSTEVGAFQAGSANADIAIVDNYPVEVRFFDRTDYDFVLDQIARNAVLNLSMIDQDVTYGIFSLKGSGAAVRSLRAACMLAHLGHSLRAWRRPRVLSTVVAVLFRESSSMPSLDSPATNGMPS